jgi:serine/threonine-protein phosphatase PPG1
MAWDLDLYLEKAYNKELLPDIVIKEICEKTKEVLLNEGNVRHGT